MGLSVSRCCSSCRHHAQSLKSPQHYIILEQNYEYDLINSKKLMDKYVGKKIKIVDWNKFQDRKEVVEATLLSNNRGPIYQINDEIYLGHPGTPVLPKLPENLIAKPTLTWLFESGKVGPQDLEVLPTHAAVGFVGSNMGDGIFEPCHHHPRVRGHGQGFQNIIHHSKKDLYIKPGERVFEWFQENGGIFCKTKTGAPYLIFEGKTYWLDSRGKEALSVSCWRHKKSRTLS